MPRPIHAPVRFCRKLNAGFILLAFLMIAFVLQAASETNGQPISKNIITNLAQFWSLPPSEKNQLHRLQSEILVYYCDTNWNVFWGHSDDLNTFLPLRG